MREVLINLGAGSTAAAAAQPSGLVPSAALDWARQQRGAEQAAVSLYVLK